MGTETLLCFGGPRDGELLTVDRPSDMVLSTVPPDLSLADPLELPPPVRYIVEKVHLHDDGQHWGPPAMHGDWCIYTARCLVAEGYPKHRITDAITALAQLASIASYVPWAGPALPTE